eukprot:TRINITY_DN9938_c0_g1_i3.p2 TRINITY_DN9938_c0_g1~~TRINITY_DN9938_c0_g1_i3.p2  ORF type:complete len:126 (-),score=12.49 TRINITY_DN9938_c0_g1_i3:189-566(-)
MSAPEQMPIGNGDKIGNLGGDVRANVGDVKGCWKSCGGLCCHYNFSTGDASFCNLLCIPVVPFPICRCFSRDSKDSRAWRSCTDLKGNYEVWKVKDRNTIEAQGGNVVLGDYCKHTMTRCCCCKK